MIFKRKIPNKTILSVVLPLAFLLSAPVSAQEPELESRNWYLALENDRPNIIEQEFIKGANPNAVDSKGNPSLMLAIRNKSWKVVDTLLANRQTNVNIENEARETPMMYLALMGETARLRDLQARGGQVNRVGWSPLHYAASKGHEETVRYLLSQKAIVNAPAPDGTSPLMMAALSGKRAVVDVLLAAGADPSMQNAQGLSPADWARSANHEQLASYLDQAVARKAAAAPAAAGTYSGGAVQTYGVPERVEQPDLNRVQTVTVEPEPAPAEDSSSSKPASSSSTSRYFDLDRFDKPVQP
ncbi:ankyrin repeat domain-containing protein [Alcaligenes faecalis]|uniref:ankyrin repeat domain-containing protein n=1 Tax=Alcaligenes TaxID=507 RepID=UPI00203FCA63|nr:ankyrin repeat domain-containing protein [Alcaligenes faecalis]MCM2558932.1 ankyrin repeat domain-containing protein [Alcaligenes faecalis]MCM2621478.1 ankyrin repeat domain-containing protein [Alcaligenes faecalis]MDK7585537.1 ankyrin repeat domain-containing protein [Alcaligenes phenolicus]